MKKPILVTTTFCFLFLLATGSSKPAYGFDSVTKASQGLITPFDSDDRLYLMDEEGNIFLAQGGENEQKGEISFNQEQWENSNYASGMDGYADEKPALQVSSREESGVKQSALLKPKEQTVSKTAEHSEEKHLSKREELNKAPTHTETSLKIFTDLFSS